MNLVGNPPGTRWERGVGEGHARKELGIKRRERAANVECSRRAQVSRPGGTHDETHDADLRDHDIPAVKRTANTIKRTGKTIDGKRMGTHNGYTGKI